MRKPRKQTGTIFQAHGMWYVRYWEDRVENGEVKHKRVAKPICKVTTRGKRPPQDIVDAAENIVREAVRLNQKPERVLTMEDFVENVYFPHIKNLKKASTQHGYNDIWNRYIKPLGGEKYLKDIRVPDVQSWLDVIGNPGTLSRNTLRNVKTFISATFKVARQQGYYPYENPVRDTATNPHAPRPKPTYAYNLDEIQAILAVLPLRPAAIVGCAAYAGLMRSEIHGELWENYRNGEILVTQAVWEGIADTPKTIYREASVPVIKPLADLLDKYKIERGSPQKGPMFPNSIGTPTHLNNVLRREILPVLNRCKHCRKPKTKHTGFGKQDAAHKYERDDSLPLWKGWHAFRRGLGTNLYSLGVEDKVIQRILRHGDVATTMKYYVQSRDDQTAHAMGKLEHVVAEKLSVN